MTLDDLQGVVSEVEFRDWEFRVLEKGDGFLLQVRFMALDSSGTDTWEMQSGRKWYISSHACMAEIVRTAWKAVEAAVLHEAQESFKYRGVILHDPHLDPDAYVETPYARSVRR